MSQKTMTETSNRHKHSKSHKDRGSGHKKRKRAHEEHEDSETQRQTPSKKSKKSHKHSDETTNRDREHTSTAPSHSTQRSTTSTLATNTPRAPFTEITTSLYLPLPPITQSHPLEGLCAHALSPLILTYVPFLHGILLAYSKPWLSNKPDRSSSMTSNTPGELPVYSITHVEHAAPHTWLTADFTILRPQPGAEMEGYVTAQNESRLGVLCWNLFNASVERRRLPKDWRWVGPTSTKRKRASPTRYNGEDDKGAEDEEGGGKTRDEEGTFVDGDGEPVGERLIKFRLVDWDVDTWSGKPTDVNESGAARLVSFEGTMLSVEEEAKIERALMVKEADRLAKIRKEKSKREKAAGRN